MAELTQLERDELPLVVRVKDWLTKKYGPIQSFDKVPSPHEHRAYYPVAFVKFTDGRELVAKWSPKTEKLGKEFQVCKLLLAHDIPTTIPVDYDPSIVIFTMERLHGESLSGYRDLSVDGLEIVEEIGRLLRSIHDINGEVAIAAGVPAWEGDDFASEMRGVFTKRLRGATPLLPLEYSSEQLQAIFDALMTQNTWKGRKALNRRDMHAENWFRLADGRLAAVDHGNASVGDIAYDLAHMLNHLTSEDAVAAFRQGYGVGMVHEATSPTVRVIADLVHGVGILGWVHKRGVSQPVFQAEALELIQRACEVAND